MGFERGWLCLELNGGGNGVGGFHHPKTTLQTLEKLAI